MNNILFLFFYFIMSLSKKHKSLILSCAEFSLNSYNDIKNCFKIENKMFDTIVYVIEVDDRIYITGPGSVSLTDWSLDFQVWRTKSEIFDNSLIHAGFLKIYLSIRSALLTHLTSISLPSSKFICTGHSLFGAISTLIAADLTSHFDNHISCITFGSPRVGNKHFSTFFNSNVDSSFRCVYELDPITFSPLPIRFKHVRGHIFCNSQNISISNNFSKWNFCGCRIHHHSMDSYLSSIKHSFFT